MNTGASRIEDKLRVLNIKISIHSYCKISFCMVFSSNWVLTTYMANRKRTDYCSEILLSVYKQLSDDVFIISRQIINNPGNCYQTINQANGC